MSEWNDMSEMPKIGKQVLLANADRMRSFDALGCIKDIGVLMDSGNGLYWYTHGNYPFVTHAYTHWMYFDDPAQPEVRDE